jgi:hypothetical protein
LSTSPHEPPLPRPLLFSTGRSLPPPRSPCRAERAEKAARFRTWRGRRDSGRVRLIRLTRAHQRTLISTEDPPVLTYHWGVRTGSVATFSHTDARSCRVAGPSSSPRVSRWRGGASCRCVPGTTPFNARTEARGGEWVTRPDTGEEKEKEADRGRAGLADG